jgi:hypothetical protein
MPSTTEPGSGGTGSGTGGGGLQIAGGGSNGGGAVSPAALDGTVIEALNGLPGGVLAWAYPTFVLAIPGILLMLAVGAQAFGALAWLPLVRRRLGDFGFDRRPHPGGGARPAP